MMNKTNQEIIESIRAFNSTEVEFPKDKTIVDLFLEQVESTPYYTAVVWQGKALNFQELNLISNQYANYLTDIHDIAHGDFVGLMIDRSEWVVISILAVLKSGAAYVPIDIEAPQKRKTFVKNDSKCKFIIQNSSIESFLLSQEKYNTQLTFSSKGEPNDLAYIIYIGLTIVVL